MVVSKFELISNKINIRDNLDPTHVTFPNGHIIQSVQTAYLNLPTLTSTGCRVHIFRDEDLHEFSLVAIGQLCDADCTTHYDKHRMWVTDARGTDIIEGTRDKITGLYMINTDHLHKPTDHLPRQLQHMGAAVTPLNAWHSSPQAWGDLGSSRASKLCGKDM